MHDDAHDENQQMALDACLSLRTPTSLFASRQQRAPVSADLTTTHRSRLSRAPVGAVKWRFSREPWRSVRPADGN